MALAVDLLRSNLFSLSLKVLGSTSTTASQGIIGFRRTIVSLRHKSCGLHHKYRLEQVAA
jgi:hypothetical protein